MALNLNDIIKVGDYLRVEQKVVCYEAGEVAHIENVMIGETRERKNTYLEREERTTETETINETEQERDTQTSERYSMQREAQKVVNQDQHFDVSLSVSGQVGPMTIAASTGFSMGQSTQQSDKTASNYAKNVVEIARNRTFKRTRSYEKLTIIKQWEDVNLHSFKNEPAAGEDKSNSIGIYRYVDKKYENRLMNYGKRLILTLMIPDPAAWHRFAATLPTAGSNTLEKPEKPNFVAKDLDETNFAEKASLYGVSGIKCPAKEIYKATSYAYNGTDKHPVGSGGKFEEAIFMMGRTETDNKNLIVDEGYEGTHAFVEMQLTGTGFPTSGGNFVYSNLSVNVGDARFDLWTGLNNVSYSPKNLAFGTKFTGVIPVSAKGYIAGPYYINVTVKCTLTDAAFTSWQLETYNKIMEAYQRKKSEYDNQLNALKARSTDFGDSTTRNRLTEQKELKKGFINLLAEDSEYFSKFNVMYESYSKYPSIDVWKLNNWNGNPADIERPTEKVSFFEESFDWDLMNYKFYPYYWEGQQYDYSNNDVTMEQGRWAKVYSIRDNDDIFEKFLQAGYAQVVVPIKLGSELEVLNFLEHGVIVNANFYASTPEISKAKAEFLDLNKPTEAVPVEISKWNTNAPTNLVILQTSAQGAPGVGLPCWESEDKRLNPDKLTLDEQFGPLNP